MEDGVEVVVERGEHVIVGDRRLDQLDARVVGEVLPLARQQVVDDEHMLGGLREEDPDEIRADEAGAAHDEQPGVSQRPTGFGASSAFKCVNVSETPKSR